MFQLVICQDIAPTLIELAGGKPGPQIQGRSLLPLFAKKRRNAWRKSFLVEYWAEQAMPWLIGMTYKAVRTDRYKLIHWVNRGKARGAGRALRPGQGSLGAEEPDRAAARIAPVRESCAAS